MYLRHLLRPKVLLEILYPYYIWSMHVFDYPIYVCMYIYVSILYANCMHA